MNLNRGLITVLRLGAAGAAGWLAIGTIDVARADGPPSNRAVLTGKDAFGDWTTDAPGVRRHIKVADLPPPNDTPSVDNGPKVVPRPEGAMPVAPKGFNVTEFASKLEGPRVIATAPNGDFFVAESRAGRIKVLRDTDGDGRPDETSVYAEGLHEPFGIAFYPVGSSPRFVFIGNTDEVVRIPYSDGDTKARTGPESVVGNIPGGGRLRGGGHWTRDVQFSLDGKTLYVSVGSKSNVDDNDGEKRRANILAFDPDGKNERVFAWGVRNAVGLAVHPKTGQLWASVNERDGLGDHLVPDYITHLDEGGFYGWPWYYLGAHQDPRHKGERPELAGKAIVPDVLLQAHSASLDITFYDGDRFPPEYRHDAFAAEHGSWNRARRTGYKVIRVPMRDGKATGEYEDFLTGFVVDERSVWGRPVGVAVARDGALLVTDDASGSIWRVAYTGDKP
jgi:glucose/arabinose dehydrogenase